MTPQYTENLLEAKLGSFANYWWDDALYAWSVLVWVWGIIVAAALAVLARIVACWDWCSTRVANCCRSIASCISGGIWAAEEQRRRAAVRAGLRKAQPTNLPGGESESESESDGESDGGDF